MSTKLWYIHVDGEIIGPLNSEVIKLFLRQGRVHFVDFVWSKPLKKWHRIVELDDFAALIPPYPSSEIPQDAKRSPAPQPAVVEEEVESDQEEESAPPAKITIKETPTKKIVMPSPPQKAPAPAPEIRSEVKKEIRTAPKFEPMPEAAAKELKNNKQLQRDMTKSIFVESENTRQTWAKVRRHFRIPCTGKAKLDEHGEYELINISERGIFVQAKNLLPIGTEVALDLHVKEIDKEMDRMTGVVIRHGTGNELGFAIEFTRLNPVFKRLILEYISSKD